MAALWYLFFTKMKAAIRNVFAKPLPALLTVLALALFAFLAFLSLTSPKAAMATNVTSIERLVMLLLGYVTFMLGVMLFQPRTALVKMQDAHYVFAGPFSRRQILTYLLVDTMQGSVLFAFGTVFYFMMLTTGIGMSASFMVLLIVQILVLYYFIFVLITYFYLLEITRDDIKKVKLIIGVLLVLVVGGLFLKNLLAVQFDFQKGFAMFLSDPTFNALPMLGWAKWALMSMAEKQYATAFLAFSLSAGACILITWLILTVKGDFYEKAYQDSIWYADLRQNMREGKSTARNFKVKAVNNAKFLDGAGAILSKNVLELRKTKSWLRKQDLFLMLFYLLLAKLMGMDFIFFQYYILIVLMMSVNTDYIIQELKKHYIYLIPEHPFRKLLYLVTPVIARLLALVAFALVPAWIVFRVNPLAVLSAFINLAGYAMVFVGGNIWSLKIMKSRNNAVVEQFLKLGVLLLAVIPAVGLSIVIAWLVPVSQEQMMTIIAISSMAMNILVGALFILNAKSMLLGTNLMAD